MRQLRAGFDPNFSPIHSDHDGGNLATALKGAADMTIRQDGGRVRYSQIAHEARETDIFDRQCRPKHS
jgi:hypothetical protein